MNNEKQNKTTVLVVDDNSTVLDFFKFYSVSDSLHEYDYATSYTDALKKIQSKNYSAVITDYELPDGDGVEILDYCACNCKNTKRVMMSGHSKTEIKKKCKCAQLFEYFIEKPLVEDLIETLFKKISL